MPKLPGLIKGLGVTMGTLVRTVKDGAEALAAIDEAVPDLVLLAVDLDKHKAAAEACPVYAIKIRGTF